MTSKRKHLLHKSNPLGYQLGLVSQGGNPVVWNTWAKSQYFTNENSWFIENKKLTAWKMKIKNYAGIGCMLGKYQQTGILILSWNDIAKNCLNCLETCNTEPMFPPPRSVWCIMVIRWNKRGWKKSLAARVDLKRMIFDALGCSSSIENLTYSFPSFNDVSTREEKRNEYSSDGGSLRRARLLKKGETPFFPFHPLTQKKP